MSTKSALYYECHITVEPVFDGRLQNFKEICLSFGFRAADLLMKKRVSDLPERSQNDTFATSRDNNYEALLLRMVRLVSSLRTNGYQVWRYKIEDTLLDSKFEGDCLRLGLAVSRQTKPIDQCECSRGCAEVEGRGHHGHCRKAKTSSAWYSPLDPKGDGSMEGPDGA